MRKKPTKQPKSNVVAFPSKSSKPVINGLKAAFLPVSKETRYFHIPKELSAPLGSSTDVLARAESVEIKNGELVFFHLADHSPWILGRVFKLDGWFIRDENDTNRIYPVETCKNARKIIEYADADMSSYEASKEVLQRLIPPVKKTRRRREFPHLTAEDISFFDIDIIDEAG